MTKSIVMNIKPVEAIFTTDLGTAAPRPENKAEAQE